MRAVSSLLLESIWAQFQLLISAVFDTNSFGYYPPRVDNRIVFEKIIQLLVLGCKYQKKFA